MSITEYAVVIFTPSHSISGNVRPQREQRLSDYLNDRRETVIRLHDADFARLNQPYQIVDKHAEAVVSKDFVVIAFEPSVPSIEPTKRLFGYVKKQTYEVYLLLDGVEVRGFMHSTSPLDILEIHRIIAASGEKFLPVTSAVVTMSGDASHVFKPAAAIVNVQRIQYIAKTGEVSVAERAGTRPLTPPAT